MCVCGSYASTSVTDSRLVALEPVPSTHARLRHPAYLTSGVLIDVRETRWSP